MYSILFLIDADEERAQRIARLLTLADYRIVVTTNPYQALERSLQESLVPQAILLGQEYVVRHPTFMRLLTRLYQEQHAEIPLLPVPSYVPEETPLYADPAAEFGHVRSEKCAWFLNDIESFLQVQQPGRTPPARSLVMDTLPATGLAPRISKQLRSTNKHFRNILAAAYELIGETRWKDLVSDVGLARYQHTSQWPPDNDEHAIPAEVISCLHQAVAFSAPGDPVEQLRLWSMRATDRSLQKHRPGPLVQQALSLLPPKTLMRIALNGFVHEINAIRGEDLHAWALRPDGSYWIIHYSNLYAYGRYAASTPACHVWIASLEHTLRLVGLGTSWKVSERECSCATLTGHCLFEIQPVRISTRLTPTQSMQRLDRTTIDNVPT